MSFVLPQSEIYLKLRTEFPISEILGNSVRMVGSPY